MHNLVIIENLSLLLKKGNSGMILNPEEMVEILNPDEKRGMFKEEHMAVLQLNRNVLLIYAAYVFLAANLMGGATGTRLQCESNG